MAIGNDVQFISSNNIVQTDQPNSGVVTHQPPPAYGQINTQPVQSPYQNPMVPVYLSQNGQMIPVSYVNNGVNGPYTVLRNRTKGHEQVNIIWSGCNILCCFCLLGIIALVISIVTLNMRRNGNDQGARCGNIWATIINAIATIVGIVVVIIVSLKYFQ